jgi:large subunit ribosomal protein L19
MEKLIKKYMKKNIPDVRTGDTVKVHLKVKEGNKERIQIFEGLVIAVKHGQTLDGTFTVRKESFGIGVERVFPVHSPRIVKVERVKQSKVRRSKLYYMRDLHGKNARLKDLNRDHKVWEEKGAEAEIEKIAEEVAAAAEEAAEAKAEETEVTEALEPKEATETAETAEVPAEPEDKKEEEVK